MNIIFKLQANNILPYFNYLKPKKTYLKSLLSGTKWVKLTLRNILFILD